MEFRNKQKRTECYNARDKYFECLDSNQENKDKCPKEYKSFNDICGAKWTDHFIKRRSYLRYKEKYLREGDAADKEPEKQSL